jgi:toxin ParE1/3/4
MNYRISPRANADIEAICDRIAENDPAAADRLDERFHQAIRLLAQFPRMGHTRPDVQDKRYLFWAVGKYVIAYRVEGDEVIVVRVLHGHRDFRKLFKRKPQEAGYEGNAPGCGRAVVPLKPRSGGITPSHE